MRILAGCLAAALLLGPARGAAAYPLDGFRETGITRLEAYRLAQDGLLKSRALYEGALLPSKDVQLRMLAHPDYVLPDAPDPAFTEAVRILLGEDAEHYGIAVLDITDPAAPQYAEIAGNKIQNPGSVGKVAVVLAWMQALADIYPDDVAARKRVLREAQITANEFIVTDEHVVPFWNPGDPRVVKRPIEQGDTANVWTYLDWMCSSSSNAAAAMLMSHLMLLKHFGAAYPPSPAEADEFFRTAGNVQKSKIFLDAIRTPLTRNGLDLEKLRQGSFFTRRGKQLVSGTNSIATPRELLRFSLLMEQGKLVDEWSSLEIKRLLYLTDRRIRYASSPALSDAAVYFKSGSLYSCQPEPGFECKKYHGNRKNFMNSTTLVETTDKKQPLRYISVVLSNVLRKNSAVEHQTLATRIHRLIQGHYQQSLSTKVKAFAADPELRERAKSIIEAVEPAGESDEGVSGTSDDGSND
jgi:hypothetical protein